MRIKNDQAGLTLVELLVTIVVASIVTLAACTMLLFGLRINNQSTKTSMGQNTVQVLMEALEDVAAEAQEIQITDDGYTWLLSDNSTGRTFFSYANNVIYSGKYNDISAIPFLENVQESYVTLSENGLLTFDVVMQQGNYSTSVYCRMNKNGDTTGMDIIEELTSASLENDYIEEKYISYHRYAFLKKLASQYGSKGKIVGTDTYYATWYNSDWGEEAAWCACYISWVIAQDEVAPRLKNAPKEAYVDSLRKAVSDTDNSKPGDLIFFNFDEDAESDHVGVVLTFSGNYIYTIEGNTAGKVAVRKYAVGDPRIMGYGILNWN